MTWKQARSAVHTGAVRGLETAAEHLKAASNRVAPIEHDTLIQSSGTDVDRDALQASVFYDTDYAVIQHEDLSERHDPGREGKYLERPLHTEAPKLADLIADGLRGELR